MKLRWRFGIIAGLFLAVFSLYPQLKLVYLRGSDWNGHYAYNDIDEVAYAAYLKALIDGRPRKNDPYTGRDDTAESPQPESLFSVQFAGPYTIAIPARVLGMSAQWAMTISGAIAAFLTALAIFWLLGMITRDSLFAMGGSLFVLAGGALFAGEGAIGEILATSYAYPYFPGFRRYVPAMAFPAFFLLVALVWKLVGDDGGGTPDGSLRAADAAEGSASSFGGLFRNNLLILFSAVCFGYSVFSYFYVWTTAAGWLACLGLFLLILRPTGVAKDLKKLAVLGVVCVAFILPYAYLLSNRSHTMDDVQMLVITHAPDLGRPPALICYVVLMVIAVGVLMKMFRLRDRGTLFAISLALAPIVLFNQQIITGQSLQPIHYQVFIGNYVAGLAVVVTLGLIWRTAEGREHFIVRTALVIAAMAAAGWGFVECHYTVRILDEVNVMRDEALPAARRLAELAKGDPHPHESTVLHLGIAEADDLPTVAPQSVLWARHQHVFAGVTWQENKERYYQLLYYSGVDERSLADAMKRGEDIVSVIALFGWGRHTDRLNSQYKPLTYGEIDAEAAAYGNYVKAFDPARYGVSRLEYLIVPDGIPDSVLANIDKWFIRSDAEQYGKYSLYKLHIR